MITPEQKDILNEYAKIKGMIKVLEEQADELNPKVLGLMKDNEFGEIEVSDIGKLCLGSRRKWNYSEKVTELDGVLKEQKKIEEQTGEATYIENKYVIFKSI